MRQYRMQHIGNTDRSSDWTGQPTGEGNPPWSQDDFVLKGEMAKTIRLDFGQLSHMSIGRLGATVPVGYDRTMMLMAALDMAERHIVRLSEALRRAGIDVDGLPLPPD